MRTSVPAWWRAVTLVLHRRDRRTTRWGELGRGGMGAVHLARQASLRRMVAIKTIRSDQRSINSDAAFLDGPGLQGRLNTRILSRFMMPLSTSVVHILHVPRINGRAWSEVIDELSLQENGNSPPRWRRLGLCPRPRGAAPGFKPANIVLGNMRSIGIGLGLAGVICTPMPKPSS